MFVFSYSGYIFSIPRHPINLIKDVIVLIRKSYLLFISILLVGLLVFTAGCGKSTPPAQESPNQGQVAQTGGDQSQPKEEKPDESKSEEDLTPPDLFSRGESMTSFSFDYVLTSSEGEVVESKMWITPKRMRTDMESFDDMADTGRVTSIIDGENNFMLIYMVDEGTATKFTIDSYGDEEEIDFTGDYPDPYEMVGNFNDDGVNFLRKEVLNGKNTLVYSTDYGVESGTIWVWEDYGIPIKIEIFTEDDFMSIEYRNFYVGPIDDSIFEIPDDVEIMDMTNFYSP